jgi:hypothetical protein
LLIALIITWPIHGLVTEAVLYRCHCIARQPQNWFGWLVETGLLGMAANGYLLRRGLVRITERQALLVAGGWIVCCQR